MIAMLRVVETKRTRREPSRAFRASWGWAGASKLTTTVVDGLWLVKMVARWTALVWMNEFWLEPRWFRWGLLLLGCFDNEVCTVAQNYAGGVEFFFLGNDEEVEYGVGVSCVTALYGLFLWLYPQSKLPGLYEWGSSA